VNLENYILKEKKMLSRRKFLVGSATAAAVIAAGIIPSPPAATGQVLISDNDWPWMDHPDGQDFTKTLQKYIEEIAEQYMFRRNDAITRKSFTNSINNFCKEYKHKREIQDFIVICDDTNNLPSHIDENVWNIDVYYKKLGAKSFTCMSVMIQNI
jgi:hypothetical protein